MSDNETERSFEQERLGDGDRGPAPMPPTTPEHVVGIGASAGGLEALREFVSSLVASPEVAFIVTQHLAPGHDSMLVDLLSRSTSIPVVQAHDGASIAGGMIVVAPPSCDVSVDGSTLHVESAPDRFGPSPSIDLLFESLAQSWGDRAVAVILSGTGSDGALGMRAVRSAGGLCLAQAPASAQFSGMPEAAIALGGAEWTAPAEELGSRVSGLARSVIRPDVSTGSGPDALLEALQTRVKAVVGIDFDRYKRSTVWRQVNRRMSIRGVVDLEHYVELLAEDSHECQSLAGSLLVSVTSFFRDPDAFRGLAERLRAYVEGAGLDSYRVWVPGCATGEEAYSIAMLMGEALGFPADLSRRLKVFGTDLDEAALSIARRGRYSESALAQIPDVLRSRYTRAVPDGFRVAEVLRECTVFAQQDVGHDPPFPQVDVVSCRNTLIYFNESLQRDVLRLLAFSLKPGGILFLGKAERISIGGSFTAVDADRRIFIRTSEGVYPALHSSRATSRARRVGVTGEPSGGPAQVDGVADQVALLESILRGLGESFLVMDPQQQLIHVVGDVAAYCRLPEGHVGLTANSFLREELQSEARSLMLLAAGGLEPVIGQFVHLDDESVVQMTLIPARVGEVTYLALSMRQVEAEELATAGPQTRPRSEDFDQELQRLDRELQASQDVLRRSMTELQGANQELEATSEELQSSLEELQSANEELQASNEELEATNEELVTAIDELRRKGEEVEKVNLDLRNIQAATNEGMVFVDRQGCVTSYTPMAVRVFALTPADLGRPLVDVATSVPTPPLREPLARVIEQSSEETFEVASASENFLMRLIPYVNADDDTVGAIVALTEVSRIAQLRDQAEAAFTQLEQQSELLTRQATIDEVTNISNRSAFTTILSREVDRCSRSRDHLAVAWIDLDNFKEVNDGLGHEAGDLTLRACADRLAGLVRGSDVVGRLGGDEFGVILAGQDCLGSLDNVLERIVTAFHEPVSVPNGEARVTASVGVSVFPEDARTGEALLRAADSAMYAVKALGGDGFAYFDQTMNENADERRFQRHRISRALTAGEFELHFQPVVSVDESSVWGAEALLRWDDEGRLRAAEDFIGFAEVTGQIRRFSEIAMRGAREAISTVRRAGLDHLCMSINFGVAQLSDPDLLDVMQSWPVPESLSGLVIEVTESVFLPDHRHALEALTLFAEMGARVAVDDFGSGYSNFRLLESLSPDLIKLDRSYLGAGRDRNARLTLMRSTVQLAHVVGARVIVEGIETQDHLELAREAGADFVQGFLIARPMPLTDLVSWLETRRASGRLEPTGC